MTSELKAGQKVTSTEWAAGTVGEVGRVTEQGAQIDVVTPASKTLPYGHIGNEFWPVADWNLLTVVGEREL